MGTKEKDREIHCRWSSCKKVQWEERDQLKELILLQFILLEENLLKYYEWNEIICERKGCNPLVVV